MNTDEAKAFLKDYALVAFPSVRTKLAESEQPVATFAMWAKVLSAVNRDEAERVIDVWLDGSDSRMPAPMPYQWDAFATHLRSCVMHLRGEASRSKALAEQKQHLAEGVRHTKHYIEENDHWPEWLEIQGKIFAGELPEREGLRQWYRRIDEIFSQQQRVAS